MQRIDYLGSVYYFFHGVPRVICLAAPLSALLFGISPVHATVADLVHLFGSYFFASLIMMRTISGGTRNAFWADVYETAMCFSLSRATIATMLRPRKPRAFVVTPKGEKLEKRGVKAAVTVIPHLVLFGLLLAGITVGFQLWLTHGEMPGLEISLFWGGVNLFLVSLAILSANELPQWRNSFRLPRRLPCELVTNNTRVPGLTKDLSEHGACIDVKQPLLVTSGLVTFHLPDAWGAKVAVQGMITRQEKTGSAIEVGVSFLEPAEAETRAITAHIFTSPSTWAHSKGVEPGIWRSFRSLLAACGSAWQSRRPARRHFPRLMCDLPCEIAFHGRSYAGRTKDLCFVGLAVVMDDDFEHESGPALVYLEGITLKVRLVSVCRQQGRAIAQFRVESVDKGEARWQALNVSVR